MNPSLYTRPDKPSHIVVQHRIDAPVMARLSAPPVITVDKTTECHVTPSAVALRMVDHLQTDKCSAVLEPQAGTGNLIKALLDSGLPAGQITAIEKHIGLCQSITGRFTGDQLINPENRCFLDYAKVFSTQKRFSRIIMNPPFRQIKKHMNAALSLLATTDAILIALVPTSYQHPDANVLETLADDTFFTARVSTKIIRIQH
jgi:phospholipid N-methyltransferase